jgi:hypothetical protein
MVVLLILCAYHAIIGTIVFIHDHYATLDSDSHWTWLDRIVLFTLLGLYLIIHLIMGIWYWHIFVAKRRHMKTLDDRYNPV